MITTSDFKNGMTIIVDGELFSIVSYQFVKPGKGGAYVKTRLRSIRTGNVLEKTFDSGDAVEQAFIENKKMEYLYKDGSHYVFMDVETYEQVEVDEKYVEDLKDLLKENAVITIDFYEGKIIGVELPNFMELVVTYTEPGFKGDTATGTTKPATLETGAVIQVPLFVNAGDKIKIDTRTRTYLQRA